MANTNGNGDNEDATIIQPPDNLTGKVRMGTGGVDAKALERAEALIANLQGDYLEWAQEDAEHLMRAVANLESGHDDSTAAREELFRIAHDMKGQGGSFGYDLVTVVGDRLCRFLEKAPAPLTPAQMKAVRLHAETMRLIIAQRIEGDGGTIGGELLGGLDKVIEKVGR